jgi:hypothetical protein
MANNKSTSSGLGLGSVLFIVFLILKLTGNINWSWWWVTSPLWIPITLGVIVLGIIGLIAVLLNKK